MNFLLEKCMLEFVEDKHLGRGEVQMFQKNLTALHYVKQIQA